MTDDAMLVARLRHCQHRSCRWCCSHRSVIFLARQALRKAFRSPRFARAALCAAQYARAPGSNASSVVVSVGLALAMLVVVLVLQVNLQERVPGRLGVRRTYPGRLRPLPRRGRCPAEAEGRRQRLSSRALLRRRCCAVRSARSTIPRWSGCSRAGRRRRSCCRAKSRSPIAQEMPTTSQARRRRLVARSTIRPRRWCRCTRASGQGLGINLGDKHQLRHLRRYR
jgi:hypothetical protein